MLKNYKDDYGRQAVENVFFIFLWNITFRCILKIPIATPFVYLLAATTFKLL